MNLWELSRGDSPLVIDVPHAGTHVPDAIAARLTDAARPVPDTDWHVEKLYAFARDAGATLMAATHSRFVVDLNRDLFKLGEELLYPASTQVAVFLSVDVGTFFALDSVTLKVDDKEVANYLYTDREVQALHRGGVQKLYLGNLKAGSHEIVAFFTGKGPHERDYRRGTTLKVDKTIGAKYVELRISDRAASLQPEFVVRQWE